MFLTVLDRATNLRLEHGWLLWLLPAAGLGIGAAQHWLGKGASGGTNLLLDEIHEHSRWVPRRMAPLVLVGTWTTHLFGGSGGREGTAVQVSGSLADWLARILRLGVGDRRMLLVSSLSGAFGAVFGVPLAGATFGLEVQSVGRVRYEALVPALSASLIGDLVVRGLGYRHGTFAPLPLDVSWVNAGRVAIAGVAFGLAGAAFASFTHLVSRFATARIGWAPLRPAVGGAAVVGLALLFGRDYLGLSLPIIDAGLSGEPLGIDVVALKILFTAVTLGFGFPGGEVTPLLVAGAALGAALAAPLGLPVAGLAAIGFVAMFAGAANVPLTCTIMAAELFGSGSVVLAAIACTVAYVSSGHRGIYGSQRIHAAKGPEPVPGKPPLRDAQGPRVRRPR